TYLATIFKKIRLHTHENIGWGKIRLPQDDLHTGAYWTALPDDLVATRDTTAVEGALQGLGQLLVNVAPLLLMCDPRDLHLLAQVKTPDIGRPTVFLWESVPGGVGIGQHLFDASDTLLRIALDLATGCPCTEGCPGCVGPPPAPNLGAKSLVLRALKTMASGGEGTPEVEAAAVSYAATASR